MSETEETAALTAAQIEEWVNSFDGEELARHGWSKPRIMECFDRHPFVYCIKNGILISVIFYHLPALDTLEIIFLATVPYDRLTSTMFDLFSQLLQDHSGKQIWLECREDNLAAIRLYQKLGLRETGRRARYYHDGSAAILFNF